MRRALTAFVLGATASCPLTPARAHDHNPPSAVLRVGTADLQAGKTIFFCWTEIEDDRGTTTCAEGFRRYPDPVAVPADRDITIRIRKSQSPSELDLSATALTGPYGQALPPSESVPFSLREADGAVDVAFRTPTSCRHYYLSLYGAWPDVDEPGFRQDILWTFHVIPRLPAGVPIDCPA